MYKVYGVAVRFRGFGLSFCLSLLPFLFSGNADAATLDFEDLQPDSQYLVGDTLQSGGVSFDVIDLLMGIPSSYGPERTEGFVSVVGGIPFGQDHNPAGHDGNALLFLNAAITADLEDPLREKDVSFYVGDYGGATNLWVNGSLYTGYGLLEALDGEYLGSGVTASYQPLSDLNYVGIFTLSGLLQSFGIGGQELFVDHVEITGGPGEEVPEPMTLLLFGAGLLAGLPLRRRYA